jgi:hypothetical protein
LTPTGENGAIENDLFDFYYTTQGVRKKFLSSPAAGGLPKQTLQVPSSGTGTEYIWPTSMYLYNANTMKSVTAASSAGATTALNGGSVSVGHAIGNKNIIIVKGGGQIIGGGSTTQPGIDIVLGSSRIAIGGGTMPSMPALASHYYTYEVRIAPTGATNSTFLETIYTIEGIGSNTFSGL